MKQRGIGVRSPFENWTGRLAAAQGKARPRRKSGSPLAQRVPEPDLAAAAGGLAQLRVLVARARDVEARAAGTAHGGGARERHRLRGDRPAGGRTTCHGAPRFAWAREPAPV